MEVYQMRLLFYAPFKPLDHGNPSGDLAIAKSLHGFLTGRGHRVTPVSPLRARWIYWKPWRWPAILREMFRSLRALERERPDLWLTYHTYYKAPDLLGPFACRHSNVPYVIFQGIYSTKRRKKIRTLAGFHLNRRALLSAGHVFTNKRADLTNLLRLLPARKVTYVAPGIFPARFPFDADARAALRRRWDTGDTPVVITAAMFRPGVKSNGLSWVIRSCGKLMASGVKFQLVILGDGREREALKSLADRHLPGNVRFAGKIPREKMHRYYSAGDLFVFPGIRESLGMVFLEAQSCGLPVVAFDNGGVPEVVARDRTGFLTPPFAASAFTAAIRRLVEDESLRKKMGAEASRYVRSAHDLDRNYLAMEEKLATLVQR